MTYTQPLLLVFLLVLLGGILRVRRIARMMDRWLLYTAFLGFLLTSLPLADWLFSRPLEWWYRDGFDKSADAGAIVALSSYVDPPSMYLPVGVADNTTYAASRYASWLYKNWKRVPIVVSGGGEAGQLPVADSMAQLVEQEGVPRADIWAERQSHDTHQNVVYSAEKLRARGIAKVVLVVKADSMLRAERCFKKLGIDVLPAPFHYRTLEGGIKELLPAWSAIRGNERSLHEYGGLIWYKVRGWI